MMKVEDILKYIADNHLEAVYNKISNEIYKDFGIQSAEVTLFVTYYVSVHCNMVIQQGPDNKHIDKVEVLIL